MKMTLTEVGNMLRHKNDKTVAQIKDDVLGKVPIEVTFESEVIFKIVPKTWRNPAFLIH